MFSCKETISNSTQIKQFGIAYEKLLDTLVSIITEGEEGKNLLSLPKCE